MIRGVCAALLLNVLVAPPVEAQASKQPQTKKQTTKKSVVKRPAVKRQVARRPTSKNEAAKRAAELLKLDLVTRVEQRCDARAGDAISQEHPGFKVDKVIAYALGDTQIEGTKVIAPGAIARSKGKWYRFNFRCQTTPDGLEIVLFDYELGAEVPGWHQGELED